MKTKYWCPSALLRDGWQSSVTFRVTNDGWIDHVETHTDPTDCEKLSGPVLPGIPNVHSHAHQRAMSGLAEYAAPGENSFWTWRQWMYRMLGTIEPDDLYAIASQLYIEMLRAGYTSVAEFQYLHHDTKGRRYENPAEMTLQCQQAARDAGIGFTALPVLYQYGGFGSQPASPGQVRFINSLEDYSRIVENILESSSSPDNAVGIAPHSLRAVNQNLLERAMTDLGEKVGAIHIHIAEQKQEVEDCISWSGQRPVDWLFDHVNVDQRWCLIHATHMTATESARVARSQAIVGLCPTTEANLGDGFFNAATFQSHAGCYAIGSDSQISVSPVEELRWLEYGRRLQEQSRNTMATKDAPHTGQAMVDQVLSAGARACARPVGAIAPHHRADFIVLDHQHPRLYGRHCEQLIDGWVFSGNDNLVRDVFVGGNKVVAGGRHIREDEFAHQYKQTLSRLNT